MPSANPFSPVIDVGVTGNVGPASGRASAGLSFGDTQVGDHHAAAGYALAAVAVLYLLHTRRFRFSTRVG